MTTAKGSSARALDRADALLTAAKAAEDGCREHADEIAHQLDVTELHLHYDPTTDRVFETRTGAVLARTDATP